MPLCAVSVGIRNVRAQEAGSPSSPITRALAIGSQWRRGLWTFHPRQQRTPISHLPFGIRTRQSRFQETIVCEQRPGCGERYARGVRPARASASFRAISIQVSIVGLGIPKSTTSPIRVEILCTRRGMRSHPPPSTEFGEASPNGNTQLGPWPNLCSSIPRRVAGRTLPSERTGQPARSPGRHPLPVWLPQLQRE